MKISWPVWLAVAGFALFVEFAGSFATGGRINGWGDISFVIFFGLLAVLAFINLVRALLRKAV